MSHDCNYSTSYHLQAPTAFLDTAISQGRQDPGRRRDRQFTAMVFPGKRPEEEFFSFTERWVLAIP